MADWSSKSVLKAAWSDILAITVSNKFPYKSIILERYRLFPIYTNRNI